MTEQFCEQEAAAVRAAHSGRWEPTLRAHVDSCAVCRDAVKVVGAMNSLMVSEGDQIPSAPDPRLVWLKASFAERQKRSAVVSRIAAVAYASLLGAIGFGAYSLFGSSQGQYAPQLLTDSLTGPSAVPVVVIVAIVALALLLSSPSAKRLH